MHYRSSRSSSKKARTSAAADDAEEEEDLTADMDDPTPENSISEVKVTAANAGKAEMTSSKPGGVTLMDVDEAQEAKVRDHAIHLTVGISTL